MIYLENVKMSTHFSLYFTHQTSKHHCQGRSHSRPINFRMIGLGLGRAGPRPEGRRRPQALTFIQTAPHSQGGVPAPACWLEFTLALGITVKVFL